MFLQVACVTHNWLYQPANGRVHQMTKKLCRENLTYLNFHSHIINRGEKMENNILISFNARKIEFSGRIHKNLSYIMIQDANTHYFKKQF